MNTSTTNNFPDKYSLKKAIKNYGKMLNNL